MPPLFSLINDVNPSKMTWALKLRVVRLYGVPTYGSNSELWTQECVFHDAVVGSYWVYGKIASVETNGNWWYISCNKCPKKLTPAGGKFYCEKCDVLDSNGKIRYKIQIRVVDHTGNAAFLMWDKESTELLGKTAPELKANNDEGVIPDEIDNLIDMKVLFKVQIRSAQLGVSNGVYTVIKLTKDRSLISKVRGAQLDSEETNIFSNLNHALESDKFSSSVNKVKTPIEVLKVASDEATESTGLKRNLMDEFSATGKGKNLMVQVKKEKE
ncbi:Unknown protein [Striga hermonthica]|uniref:Replication factor A C-terminal domain-containing protein n=1 Tax=Striga hermonthica TaxID=68872 RepID=A0A9N7R1L2_STRHE|nr:Unknown protein [Striga hermonthica]